MAAGIDGSRQWLITKGVELASMLAPGTTGRLAFRLFCTPQRTRAMSPAEARIGERMAPLMATGVGHRIKTCDGTVQAYHWAATGDGPRRGRVLLVHGWTGRALVMGAFVEPLRAEGFDVVALDLPAHGDSSGTVLNMAIGARALQAVEGALGPFRAAVTHSFGGPVTLLAAEGGSPLARAMPLEKLVLIATPNSLAAITAGFGQAVGLGASAQRSMEAEVQRLAGRPIEVFRCDEFLARIGVPALVIHDDDDAEVVVANGEAIAAAAPKARLMRTKRLGHRRIIFAPTVIAETVAFLGGS